MRGSEKTIFSMEEAKKYGLMAQLMMDNSIMAKKMA